MLHILSLDVEMPDDGLDYYVVDIHKGTSVDSPLIGGYRQFAYTGHGRPPPIKSDGPLFIHLWTNKHVTSVGFAFEYRGVTKTRSAWLGKH